MKRRWWVVGATSAVGVLVAAGVQLPQAAAAPTSRLTAPAFHAVTARHLAASHTVSARGSGPSRHRAVPAGPVVPRAVAKTGKDQALSLWTGIVGTVQSPRPDLSLAVGPKQVLQLSDAGARVISKSTGSLVNATGNLQQLFNVSGVTVSEPTAVYDPVGKRFLLAGITTNNSTSDVGIVVRVSKGSTVSTSGSKWRTPYGYLTGDTTTESAPRLGVSADKVVLALAASDTGDASVAHVTVVIPKQKLYSAGSSGPKAWAGTSDSTYDGQTPVVNASSQKAAFLVVPAARDFTLISYTGSATSHPPVYVKSVTYSTKQLVDAPNVPQAGGDTLALAPAVFTASASWRANVLWTALGVGCTPSGDTVQRACLRLVRLSTAAPAPTLTGEFTLSAKGQDWFGPAVGVDKAGAPHVGFSRSTASASPGAVSAAVVSRTSGGSWTKPLTLTKGTAPFSDALGPATAPWATLGSAAVDPTAPWDVWVAPPASTQKLVAPTPNWATRPARVSFAKNAAVTRVSAARVRPGTRVTVTATLLRPGGGDGVKGLPLVLQKRVVGGRWVSVGSAKTDGKGAHRWTLRVSRTTDFRTVGQAVKQHHGQGRSVAKVTGAAVRVRLR